MDQVIRVIAAADGTRLAYATMGSGPPIVVLGTHPFSHLQQEQALLPQLWEWYERLAAGRRLVRFDWRGTGLSERGVERFDLPTLSRDLETVVDAALTGPFDLIGCVHGGPVALAYAARHPDRVRRLVLWCTYATYDDYGAQSQVQASRMLIEHDWHTYTETVAHRLAGWPHGDLSHRLAALVRASISQRGMQDFYRDWAPVDVSGLLGGIAAPTLVLRRDLPWLDPDIAARLAAGIPAARLTIVPGDSIAWFFEPEPVSSAIEAFLAQGDSDAGVPVPVDRSVRLSAREREVLRCVARGLTNSEIARDLVVSVRTVERHISNIYAKIGARRRAEATAYAIRHGLG